MRGLKAWACAVAFAASATPAFAQLTGGGGIGGGGGGIGGGGGGTGGIAGGGRTGGTGIAGTTVGTTPTTASSSGSSGGPGTVDSLSTNGLESLQPSNLQFTDLGVTGTSSLHQSNVFSKFYGNPYAMGAASGAGGFGKPLYTATSTSGSTGRTGATGRTGLNSASSQSGILIPLRVQMTYAAELRFPAAAVAPVRLQTDLRSAIDAGGLTNPSSVQVIADANNNIVLRGTVRDDEEKRLVEGLIRLTPGVGHITNDLSYPVTGK